MKDGLKLKFAARERKVALRLEGNLHFVMFYLLPELPEFQYDYSWIARRTGLAERKARAWADDLIACGLWELSAQQGSLRIKVTRKHLEIDRLPQASSVISSFMSLTAQLQTKLAADSSRSWFAMRVQTTSPEAMLSFKRKVQRAQEELVAESERAPGSVMLAYNFLIHEARPEEISEDTL